MGVVLAMLATLDGLVVWVDPFSHYHRPFKQLAYFIDSGRYQNDDISRNFTYDVVLIGTSMMENFKAGWFDNLFDIISAKIPYVGGYYKEVDQAVRRAPACNPQIRVVCRGLDRSFLFYPKDQWSPAAPSSECLMDGNLLNDVNYISDREVTFGTIPDVFARTKAGGWTTTFDEYMHWAPRRDQGREVVLKTYDREPHKMETVPSTEKSRRTVTENLEQNVLATVRANSQVTSHYFIPSYGINWWGSGLVAKGEFERQMEGCHLMARMLLGCRNICLFVFDGQFDITYNLNHYIDVIHYSEDTGNQPPEWTTAGEHILIDDTVDFCFNRIANFYANYDYDSIYE